MARKFFIILSLAVLLHDALGNFERRSYNPRFRNVNKKYQQTSSNGYGDGEMMEEMYLLDSNSKKITKTDVVLVSLPVENSFTENEVANHQNEGHSQHAIISGQRKTQKPIHSAFLEAEAGIRQSKPIVLQLLGWTGNPPPPIAVPPMPVKNSAMATSEPDMENLSVSIVFKGDHSEEIKPVSASGSLALGQDNKEELSQEPEVVAVSTVENKIGSEEPSTLVEVISGAVLADDCVSKDSEKETEESLTLVESIPQAVLAVGASKDSEKATEEFSTLVESIPQAVLAVGASKDSEKATEESSTLVESIPQAVLAVGASKDSEKATEESSTLIESIPQSVLAIGASKDSEKESEIKNDEEDIIKIPLVATFKPGMGDLDGSIIIQEDPMEEIEPESSGVIVSDSIIALDENNKQEPSQTPEVMLVEAIENIMNEEPSALVEAISQQDTLAANVSEKLEKEKDILEIPVVAISKPSDIEHPIFIQADEMEEVKPVLSGVEKPVSMIALGEPNMQESIQKPEMMVVTSDKNNIANENSASLAEALYQAVVEAGASEGFKKETEIKNIEEDIMKTAVVDNSKPDIVMPIYIREQNMEKIKPVSSGVMAADSIIELDESKKEELSQEPEIVVVTTIENAEPSTMVEAHSQDKVQSIASEDSEKVSQINNVNEDTIILPITLESVQVMKEPKKPVLEIIENENKKEVLVAKPDLIQSANLSDKNIDLLVTGMQNEESASPVNQESSVISVMIPETAPVIYEQTPSSEILKDEAIKEVLNSKVENLNSEDKKIETSENVKPEIVQNLDEIIGGTPLISQVASENLSIKIEAKPDSSIIPEISTESKLPLATELNKDTIVVVEGKPEKHQAVTIVLPKVEEEKPVILELSPINGNDKSEVAELMSANSVTVKENAVPEKNSSPSLALESKPEKEIIQAPLPTLVIPELSTNVQKQSVQILGGPIIVESKLESKIPAEKLKPFDKLPSSSVQKETDVKNTELIAAKPASEGNILYKEPQSLLENKIKEANKLDTMTENNAENSSTSNRKTKPKPNHHRPKPRPRPRPTKKPTQKPATSTTSASSTTIAAEATTSASTSSTVPDLGS